jgi:hypothetical protein
MTGSPPIAPGCAYEMPPLDPGLQPLGAGGGLKVRVFPEPVQVGQRVRFGPEDNECEVVAVEPTTRKPVLTSGPLDRPRRGEPIMIRGKLILRRVG